MMKLIEQAVVTIVCCFLLQLFLPWWSLALAAGVVGFAFKNKGYLSFLAGFIGVGLLWGLTALYIDLSTHAVLTEKVNRLLPVNSFLLTICVGALAGGMASLTGALLRALRS
ncbi:MAG: hypothetical protein KF775_04010 [Cyclobacteriaceae bacterium]|nr:hypothetical protein [Cyclobacteriaceae bacterium]